MDENTSPSRAVDLQRSYGSNWTKTNVSTLVEWLSVASFNISCLDFGSDYYRSIIRRNIILDLVLSTLSGTISVSAFGFKDNVLATQILAGIFAFFSFTIAVYTGYIKVYQVQETLEQYIKMKQEWIVFSTTIASELQLPIELRRDALFIIIKYKTTYLDLLKIDIDFPDHVKIKARASLPPNQIKLDVSTLSRIIIDIGNQELSDLQSAGIRNKDRFTRKEPSKTAPTHTQDSVDAKLNSVILDIKSRRNSLMGTTYGAVSDASKPVEKQ